jgi:hypothetical protein
VTADRETRQVTTFRDGTTVRIEYLTSCDQALEAARIGK